MLKLCSWESCDSVVLLVLRYKTLFLYGEFRKQINGMNEISGLINCFRFRQPGLYDEKISRFAVLGFLSFCF